MKQIRILVIASTLMVTITALAQQPSGESARQTHLKVLAEKLDLTEAQQTKAKPILDEMDDAVGKIMKDDTLSRKEQLDKVRPLREAADKKLRKILSDDQKIKLDELERQPHPELHDDLDGSSKK